MGQAEAKAALIAFRDGDSAQVETIARECSALNGAAAFAIAKAALCHAHASGQSDESIVALGDCLRGITGFDVAAAVADVMVEVAEQIRPLQSKVEATLAEKDHLVAQLAIASGVIDEQGAEVASLRAQVKTLELLTAGLQGQLDALTS